MATLPPKHLARNASFHDVVEPFLQQPGLPFAEGEFTSYVLELNHRPRKCLNYRTPAEVFHEPSVALTM